MLLVLPLVLSALAADPPAPAVPWRGSVTLAVPPLWSHAYELCGEWQVGPQSGLALVGGYQGIDGSAAWKAGFEGRYYPLGDFGGGMQMGGQLLYVGADESSEDIVVTAHGISATPLVGGKYVFDMGLTADVQVGWGLRMSWNYIRQDDEEYQSVSSAWRWMLNARLGWSF